jgi:hypothetical protein
VSHLSERRWHEGQRYKEERREKGSGVATGSGIMGVAGELDDRWPGGASGWAGGKSGHHFVKSEESPWAARLGGMGDAPGNARGAVARAKAYATVHGKCHREDTAGGAEPGDSP